MSIPAEYFYLGGFYWKRDGTGPYTWSGSAMTLYSFGPVAATTALPVQNHLFNRDNSGPATR